MVVVGGGGQNARFNRTARMTGQHSKHHNAHTSSGRASSNGGFRGSQSPKWFENETFMGSSYCIQPIWFLTWHSAFNLFLAYVLKVVQTNYSCLSHLLAEIGYLGYLYSCLLEVHRDIFPVTNNYRFTVLQMHGSTYTLLVTYKFYGSYCTYILYC